MHLVSLITADVFKGSWCRSKAVFWLPCLLHVGNLYGGWVGWDGATFLSSHREFVA